MVKLVVKFLLYNVCLQLDNNKEWSEECKSSLSIQTESEGELFVFVEIAAKVLFVMCQQQYEDQAEMGETNYG